MSAHVSCIKYVIWQRSVASVNTPNKFTSRKPSPWPSFFGCLLSSIAILYYRKGQQFHVPQFWAEDGIVFFADAYHYGSTSILMPSAGYHHLLLRLVAYSASYLSPVLAPHLYLFAALCAHALILAYLFSDRVNLPHKFWIGLSIVAAPSVTEIFLTLTNTQWYLALGLVLLLLSSTPRTLCGKVFDLILTFVLGLTGPFVLGLFPLFLTRTFRDKSSHWKRVCAVAAIACIIQTWHISSAMAANPTGGVVYDYILVFARYFWFLFLGDSFVPERRALLTNLIIAAACLLLYAVLILKNWRKIGNPTRTLALASLAMLLVSMFKFKDAPHVLIDAPGRYYYIPSITLIWALITALDLYPILSGFLVLTVLNSVLLFKDFRAPTLENLRWRHHSVRIGKSKKVLIPTFPRGWNIKIYSPMIQKKARKK